MLKIKRATPTTIIADPRAREPAHFTTEASNAEAAALSGTLGGAAALPSIRNC
jgi:hypothetical protein